MHHLDSWIKVDQLDVTHFIISLFTAQHVSTINCMFSIVYYSIVCASFAANQD